jgi:hypothetical protein
MVVRQDAHPVFVIFIGAFSFDVTEVNERIESHISLLLPTLFSVPSDGTKKLSVLAAAAAAASVVSLL